jgi:hypothetical protein
MGPQMWEFWVPYGVEMMPLHHVWGCHPIPTASYIHIRHIKWLSLCHAVFLRVYVCTRNPFYWPSWPQMWEFWVPYGVELMSLHHVWGCSIQTASHVHIRWLNSCYAVLRVYVCTLSIPFNWPSWPQMWEFWVTHVSLNHVWGCHPIQIASHVHVRYIKSVWANGMLSQGYMSSALYHSTGQVGPSGTSGSLMERKWCHYIMFEAAILFKPLPISILDIWYTVFGHNYMLSIGIG